MKSSTSLPLIISLVPILGSALFALEVGKKPDTPKLPGVEWVVHDGTRPQPPVVENVAAVQVPPPSDATVLFDGKNTDAWTKNWEIKDGVMIATKGGSNVTKESFGPIQLHLEWRVPAGRKVNGQGGGNSGVFLMNKFEVQILQSHNNQTYPDGQAAALYGMYPPIVNATAPQGDWQSYDITFLPPVYGENGLEKPAIVTVIHNGVVVQHAQEFIGLSTYKKIVNYPDTMPATGPIALQFHGDPIEFRNIWVRPLGERDQVKK